MGVAWLDDRLLWAVNTRSGTHFRMHDGTTVHDYDAPQALVLGEHELFALLSSQPDGALVGARLFPVDPHSYRLFVWDTAAGEVSEANWSTSAPALAFLDESRLVTNAAVRHGAHGEDALYRFLIWSWQEGTVSEVEGHTSRYPWVVGLDRLRWGFLSNEGDALVVLDDLGREMGRIRTPEPLVYIYPDLLRLDMSRMPQPAPRLQ